jgi:vancomycin permeability regulator SanA
MKRARWCLVALAAAFGVCTGLLVADGLHDDIGHADVAVVFGNKVEHDGIPSARLRARLDRTLELYREGWFRLVVVSGGLGKEGFDEAIVMKDYLVSRGIAPEGLIVDSAGETTCATARNVVRILRERNLHSVLVVSQYFHVPRAKLALRRFGVRPVYSAHARFYELRDIYSTIREVFAYARYVFRRYDAD